MNSRIKVTAVFGTALLTFGCADAGQPDGPLTPDHSAISVAHSDPSETEAIAQELARGFALGLNDAAVRAHVRDAMRVSLVTEHKLILQEFASTESGQRLMEAAAAALGVETAAVGKMISGLPEMDFYAPFRTHRLTWKGTRDVAVMATMDDSPRVLSGFATDGRVVTYDVSNRIPTEAVLVLHPAERKSRRINPQADRVGTVIQDADDGELSGSVVRFGPDGDSTIVELADLRGSNPGMIGTADETCIQECDDDGGSSGGGSTAPSDTTFLDYFEVYFDDGTGSSEVEFRAKYYLEDGSLAGERTLRYEGVEKEWEYYPHDPLIFERVRDSSSERINVKVVETDWLSDDDKGNRDFTYTDRGEIRSIFKDGTLTTNVELGWTPKL